MPATHTHTHTIAVMETFTEGSIASMGSTENLGLNATPTMLQYYWNYYFRPSTTTTTTTLTLETSCQQLECFSNGLGLGTASLANCLYYMSSSW